MIEYFPYFTAGLALLASLLASTRLEKTRWTLVFIGLGSGQIYIATVAFFVFLLLENRLTLNLGRKSSVILYASSFFAIVFLLNFLSNYNIRSLSEILQLLLYIVIFILLYNYVSSIERLENILISSTISALVISLAAVASVVVGLQFPPYIFIGRGANEGAAFIALMGVVPAMYLFVRYRSIIYVFICLFHLYTSNLATSRGSIVIIVVVIATGFFFLVKNVFIRAAMVLAALVVLALNIPLIQFMAEEQMNFSTKERVLLVQYGWDLALERFWTGWGWGATSELAAQAPTAEIYPHFHNTYVQLLVEIGVFGWVVIGLFVHFCLSRSLIAASQVRDSAVSTLVVGGLAGLAISGFFDAMLFGADRALQVLTILALTAKAVTVAGPNMKAGLSYPRR